MKQLIAALDTPVPRTRWPYVAAAVALAGVSVGVVAMTRSPKRDPAVACASTKTLVAATWNPMREAAVISKLRGYGKTAAATLEIIARLNDYAARWSHDRFDACSDEVTQRVPIAEAAARIACLDIAGDTFADTVDAVEQDSNGEAIPMWKRVAALSPVESCSSPDALKLAIRGGDHRKLMLDLARAEERGGLAVFVELRQRADAAKDSPALLEIGLGEARSALYSREYDAAEDALRRSLLLAEQLDAQTARVRVVALLARVRCSRGRDPESYLAMADAALARLDASQAGIETNGVLEAHAECAARGTDVAKAVTAYEALVARFREHYGANSVTLAEARGVLATWYRRAGRNDEAAREEAEVARVIEMYVGDRTAAASDAASAAGTALMNGDIEKAIQLQRRSADLFTGALGNDKLKAQALPSLAMFYEVTQQWRVAIDTHGELLAILDKLDSDAITEELRAEALAYRGNARLYLDEVDAAIPELEQGIELGTKRKLVEVVAVAQLALGRAWLAKKEPQRAVRLLRDGLVTHAKLGQVASYRVGIAQFALAQALWQLGQKTESRDAARDAEVSVTRGIDEANATPLGTYGLPSRRAKLDEVIKWREAHR